MLCSKYKVSELEVRDVPSPEFTDTWSPINHGYLLDRLEESLGKHKLKVNCREFGLSNSNDQMFGILDIALVENGWTPPDDFTMSIGVRNSLNKTLGAGVSVGSKVFVCDNLCFSGDYVFSKKHDKNIEEELPGLIDESISKFLERFKNTEVPFFAQWKEQEVGVMHATDFIVRLAEKCAIPQRTIFRARDRFITPPHAEFLTGTVWALFNSITELASDRETNPLTLAHDSLKQFTLFTKEFPLITL